MPELQTPRVYGPALTGLIRAAADRGDIASVLNMVPDMKCGDVVRVIEREAEFIGDSVDGFTLREIDSKGPTCWEIHRKRVEDEKEQSRNDGYDDGVEAVTRYLHSIGEKKLAYNLDAGDWEDPGED